MDPQVNPDYLDCISQVADMATQRVAIDEEYQFVYDCWETFERTAELENYRILENETTRGYMESILKSLYKIGGNPDSDCKLLRAKDADYGGSWCRRGGPGAFMMLARKWDRITNAVRNSRTTGERDGKTFVTLLRKDVREEGIQDDLRDLRGYLILCIAYQNAMRIVRQKDLPF